MVHYETLILSVPEITASEASVIEDQLENVIKNSAGKINSFERWGKYRLAYPVRNNDYGVYFLARFESQDSDISSLMKQIDDLFNLKFPQVVMRFINTRLDAKKPFTYHKPDSLEDVPSQNVDTFLRENKMEGLLKTSSSDSAERTRASESEEDMEQFQAEEE